MGSIRIYTWEEASLIAYKLEFEMGDDYYPVWDLPAEIEWAKKAWDALIIKGLANYANEFEKKYVQTIVLTLSAMFCSFKEFYHKEPIFIDYNDWFNAVGLTILQAETILHESLLKEYEEKVIIKDEYGKEYEAILVYSDDWNTEIEEIATEKLIYYHQRDVYNALIEKYRDPGLLYISLMQTQDQGECFRWIKNGMWPTVTR